MERFAGLCEAVAATSARNGKVRLVADYLREVSIATLPLAATFASGRALSRADGTLNFGGSQIIAAARTVFEFGEASLRQAYGRYGDLGGALADIAATSTARPALFPEPLTLQRTYEVFKRIAAATGNGAAGKRIVLFASLLRDASPSEVKYLVKLVTGDVRIGLKEALVIDALALAFEHQASALRRALMGTSDIGALATLAASRRLDAARAAYGAPIGFMLASPLPYGGAYAQLDAAAYLIEDKFDGIRVQVHANAGQVRLFSRRLNEVTPAYPEIAEALRHMPRALILDAELLAWQNGRALPFAALQPRLQRKRPPPGIMVQIPICLMIFDLLAEGEQFLIDLPLRERRRRLEGLRLPSALLIVSPARWFDVRAAQAAQLKTALESAYHEARERGNEGLMLKSADSSYLPGRRGRLWFKLKRELSTLDCVVVGVEYGQGKRKSVLSDYTFAVRDGDRLLTLGKAYSGLTDTEIAERTEWFLRHTIRREGHRLSVEPEVVVEIAFDIVQPSSLHDSGYALRFPRIVRLRPDKGPTDASSIEEVRALARR